MLHGEGIDQMLLIFFLKNTKTGKKVNVLRYYEQLQSFQIKNVLTAFP